MAAIGPGPVGLGEGFVGPGTLPGGGISGSGFIGKMFKYPREWYESLTRTFAGTNPEAEIYPDVSSVGMMNADLFAAVTAAFNVSQNSVKIHDDLTFMVENSPIVSTILDTIRDTALGVEKGGVDGSNLPFVFRCSDKNVAKIVEDFFQRTSLYDDAPDIFLYMITYGTAYREAVYDPNIGGFTRLLFRPEEQIWPNRDQSGSVVPGYVQRSQHQMAGQAVVEYEHWQIVPFIFGKVSQFGKGTGLFTCARRLYRKLQYLEEGMILARLVRAYAKMVHRVPIPFNRANNVDAVKLILQGYADEVERKRMASLGSGDIRAQFSPKDVVTDFVLPRYYHPQPGMPTIDAEISILEGSNAQLSALEDMHYLRDQLISRGRVPRRYLGLPEVAGAVAQGGLDSEDAQFARVLRSAQTAFIRGLRKIVNYELVANGVDPRELDYLIEMPKINVEDRFMLAQVAATEMNTMFTFSQVLDGMDAKLFEALAKRYVTGFSEEEMEELIKQVRAYKQMKEQEEQEATAAEEAQLAPQAPEQALPQSSIASIAPVPARDARTTPISSHPAAQVSAARRARLLTQ